MLGTWNTSGYGWVVAPGCSPSLGTTVLKSQMAPGPESPVAGIRNLKLSELAIECEGFEKDGSLHQFAAFVPKNDLHGQRAAADVIMLVATMGEDRYFVTNIARVLLQ